MEMHEKIKDKMYHQRITQREMARRIGITTPSLWRYLSGQSQVGADKLLRILHELGAEIVWKEPLS